MWVVRGVLWGILFRYAFICIPGWFSVVLITLLFIFFFCAVREAQKIRERVVLSDGLNMKSGTNTNYTRSSVQLVF